jgi:hypothetical protein
MKFVVSESSVWSLFFHALVKLLKDKGLLQDEQVLVEEQVAMFLYTLAKNASNRSVQERFQRSCDTVSCYFHIVIEAITQLSAEIITLLVFLHPNLFNQEQYFILFLRYLSY